MPNPDEHVGLPALSVSRPPPYQGELSATRVVGSTGSPTWTGTGTPAAADRTGCAWAANWTGSTVGSSGRTVAISPVPSSGTVTVWMEPWICAPRLEFARMVSTRAERSALECAAYWRTTV